ncbi:single-stranded-DNA-specific exonuclease RecJ [Tuberibacillus sp. Marseille-P3662]|uniref:single-stranded-DNA-specific exonuclease RecJ n=1 Tax=Tuberibacillus sp. Marseille-P3662 TaxID=1965358 RepID=UPI000A1CEA39|nr:single-stranded-DNA-specific exonuclease RecJ [Tuberibacillus sp. Marseille-P3662]
MLKANTRWQTTAIDDHRARQLADDLDVPPILGRLLIGRGIDDAEAARIFLHTERYETFQDPFLLKGMAEASERIHQAIAKDESILVFGDYDADGVSATSLMVTGLRELGAHVTYYVPDRFKEGYGPNVPAIEQAYEDDIRLIITVDTGISALESAERAKALGMDYIITDHHEPPPALPDAYSIINPKQLDCSYPFTGLAGVGVAFKVIHALRERAPEHLLDLVAVGTIADLVPLIGENRLMATKGLRRINDEPRPGLQALMAVSRMNPPVAEDDIGFAIGPRVNAAGRMDHAMPAIELMLAQDQDEADQLAATLDQLNKERKKIVDEMTTEAVATVEALPDHRRDILIVAKEQWNAGVIGITASRLVEKFYRPTIVFGIDPDTGEAKGSARSIEGFDIFSALSQSRDLLPHFGGHPMAAGMTTSASDLDELAERLNTYAAEHMTADMLVPATKVNSTVAIEDVSVDVLETIDKLAPFGVDNPKPTFAIHDANVREVRQIGRNQNHLKLTLEQNGARLDVIGFGHGHQFDHISTAAKISVVGELVINEWNGFRKPQLMLKDLEISEWQLFDLRNKRDLPGKIETISKQQRLLLAFHEETVQDLKLEAYQSEIVGPDDLDLIDTNQNHLFILDLPDDEEAFDRCFQAMAFPERIYAVFHQKEAHYFSGIPQREAFKWVYGFLYKNQPVQERPILQKIANHKGWSLESLQFIIQVFSDLKFVKIEDGVISLIKGPAEQSLTASITYQQKEKRIALEEQLCFSTYQTLKQWFAKYTIGRERTEEAIT